MNQIISMLEDVANSVESKGLVKEANDLDVIANTIEAGLDIRGALPYMVAAIMALSGQSAASTPAISGGNMTKEQITEWLKKNAPKIEQDAKKHMSLDTVTDTNIYQSTGPEHVEEVKVRGGNRFTPQSA